jgi:hypothetical protein
MERYKPFIFYYFSIKTFHFASFNSQGIVSSAQKHHVLFYNFIGCAGG